MQGWILYLALGVMALVGIVMLWGWVASVRLDESTNKNYPKLPH